MARLSFHKSIHVDLISILIHLPSITTFDFRVKQDFNYPALNIPVSGRRTMADERRGDKTACY